MGAQLIPQEVRDLAAGIADDIERLGHYRQPPDIEPNEINRLWAPERWNDDSEQRGPDMPCCVVMNPHWTAAPAFATGELHRYVGVFSLVDWNDSTPTAEVLATLRKIAAGERP